jgi:hypothetical protein
MVKGQTQTPIDPFLIARFDKARHA